MDSTTPGYWTLTATSSPLSSRARWTWPMLAAANGCGDHSAKSRRGPDPSSSGNTWATVRGAMGWVDRCKMASTSRAGAGMAKSRLLAIWPTFMANPFISPSVSTICRAIAAWVVAATALARSSLAKMVASEATAARAVALAAMRDSVKPREERGLQAGHGLRRGAGQAQLLLEQLHQLQHRSGDGASAALPEADRAVCDPQLGRHLPLGEPQRGAQATKAGGCAPAARLQLCLRHLSSLATGGRKTKRLTALTL